MKRRTLLAEALRARLLSDPALGPPSAETLKDKDEITRLEVTSADVEPVVDRVVNEVSILACVGRLLDETGISINWDAGRPRLEQGCFATWMWLIDDFDPDVLLCCDLFKHLRSARRKVALEELSLGGWGLFAGYACDDLERLLSPGFADMHVHLGGARQPIDVWRRLVNGTLDVDGALPRPQSRKLRPPKLPERFSEPLGDMLDFREACVRRCRTDDPASFLAEERRWCLRLVTALGDVAENDEFRRNAERYFWVKHHLWRGLRQPEEGSPPGLFDFSRVWFKAVPRDVSVSAKRPKSKAVIAREHRIPFLMLLQRGLERLELRLTPFRTAAAYSRFFQAWEEFEREVFIEAAARPEVSFSVHLQRNAGAGGRNPLKLLDRFDHDTAALHLFRQLRRDHFGLESDAEHTKRAAHVARLVRIDLASVERNGPVRYAAPFFRLLRGDEEALCALKENRVGKDQLPSWTDLHARDLACPEFGTTRLGASCHAGEDFGVLIVGLKEIADAIDGMKLDTGDSIGHGLAMGWDPAAFEERIGWASNVAAGELLDALIWLRLEMDDGCPADPNGHQVSKIDRWIDVRLFDIYKTADAVALLRGRRNLERYREAALFYPLMLQGRGNDPRIDELVRARYENSATWQRFNVPQSWPACEERSLAHAVLAWLQSRLRKRCAKRGIVVELHPSSNLRISGLRRLEDGPTMRLLLADEKFPKAIGTDDPGVFATDVANEFALIFEALLETDMSRDQARALLEQCRRDALEAIRWPSKAASPID